MGNNTATLIEKFWNGQTSESEEQELKRLLAQSTHDEHAALREYFLYTNTIQDKTLPSSFDNEMTASLPGRESTTRQLWPYMSVAAAILLTFAAVFLIRPNNSTPQVAQNEFVDTYEDPNEAYEAVKAALLKVSNNINVSMDHTKKLRNFNRIQQQVKK